MSLANIPTTHNVAFVQISSNQSTVNIDGVYYDGTGVVPVFGDFTDGKELHVFVTNTNMSSPVTITLPSAEPYFLCGEDTALTLGSNEIVEINFISFSSGESIFVKAVKSALTFTNPPIII